MAGISLRSILRALSVTGSEPRKPKRRMSVRLSLEALEARTVLSHLAGDLHMLDLRVASKTDDAEEAAKGIVLTSSPDLQLALDKTIQTVGMRFSGLAVPPSAKIAHAYIQFQSDKPSSDTASLTIQAEASDNAKSFSTSKRNISSRALTTESVPWSPDAWPTLGEKGPSQQTPDLAPLIQEIVDRDGWAARNALAIIVTGSGTRTAESFEGSKTGAPLLHVEYLTDNTTPVVTSASFTLAENISNGAAVGTVAASDADADQRLRFSITAGNTAGAFAIDPATGAITVQDAGQLDFETTPRYMLTVRATDNGPGRLSGSAAVTINLTDVDEAPVVAPGSFRVAKNSANGAVVGKVTARHADAGQTVSFSITGGNTAAAFAINSSTGDITVRDARQLNPATTPQYDLTVTATDNGPNQLAGSATVTIRVFDPSASAPVTFRAVGDVPYTSSSVPKFSADVAKQSSADEFYVHVGDLKSGGGSCPDSAYTLVDKILRTSVAPAFIIPGDNDWTDCSNPSQAWGFWAAHFMRFDLNWKHNLPVVRQANRQENFAFVDKGVLFIGVHLVGGSVKNAAEWSRRLADDSAWLKENFARFGDQVRSAVVFAHSAPNGDRQSFGDVFVATAKAFGKPVLYVHGSDHSFKLDKPFSAAPKVTRLCVISGTPSIRITVTEDAANPFVFNSKP